MERNKQNSSQFALRLLDWFDVHGRHDLPWQFDKTPYRVWVSEIMLQQTQVQTVIPYYQRFMSSFPTIQDLAAATQDEVLSHWSGLGYYARGRNLHAAAQKVVAESDGIFPQTFEQIVDLPGIGRSTANAILSIAFEKKAAILDGNVKRVLCRYDAVESWSGNRETEASLWVRAEALTPETRFADYTQAIMDLGATVCSRSKPKCVLCPLQADCESALQDRVSEFPYSKPKKAKPEKATQLWVYVSEQQQIWLEKRPMKGIWGGLWSLPESQKLSEKTISDSSMNLIECKAFKHTFTHYHLWISPVICQGVIPEQQFGSGSWFSKQQALEKGLPAPVRQIIEEWV